MAPPVRVFSRFPARPLRGRPPGAATAYGWSLVMLLLFGSMLLFLLGYVAPGLVTDWQVRPGARLLRDGAVEGTGCKGGERVEICSLTLSAPAGDGTVERRVHYVFASNQGRIAPARTVADPSRPGWLTTDVALDRFWNRVASFVGATLALGAILAASTWAAGRIVLRCRAWRRADALPVSVRLLRRERVHNGQVWFVQDDDGRTDRWPVPRRAEPFVLGPDNRILGLRRLDGTASMPLDSRLRWVDLTRPERDAVLAR